MGRAESKAGKNTTRGYNTDLIMLRKIMRSQLEKLMQLFEGINVHLNYMQFD